MLIISKDHCMHLVFSWFADSSAWPEHPGEGTAVFDREVVGPLRLLDHVETMLGLGRPQIAAVKRIAIFQRKLIEAGAGRFWSKSFGVDPWSATRELLSWRDELVEAGWRPGIGVTRTRLADLSAAEEAGPDLPPGRADRLRAAIDALGENPSLRLSSIMLIDERALLPIGWRALLDALERCGVRIEQARQPEAAPLDDGRLTLLTAGTEIVAADALSTWLAANAADNENLVFVLGKDTSLLDHALARAGLPRLGKSSQSPHRALLQVLPLAFALAWNPPDPSRLLDFLLLPMGPIPRRHANRLAGVVAAQPGVGGEEWLAAWTGIEESLAKEEGADAKKDAKRIAEWRAFVEPQRHDPKQGMPRIEAKAIADRVGAWANLRANAEDGDHLFHLLAGVAADLSEAIDTLGDERLDRVLIERMIEQALGDGSSDPLAVAEAAPWRAVSHPGAIWGEAKTVVWWHFADPEETSAAARWNKLERVALAEAGCPLDEPERELELLAAAWERPLRHAREKVLFVRPTFAAGAETSAHPLWHSLAARRRDLEDEISVRAETVLSDPAPAFANRTLTRSPVEAVAPPDRRQVWKAPPEAVAPREFESASSLSTLLSCPLRWTLAHACRLRPGVRQSVPDADKLVGIVAHHIAEEILRPGPPPSPEAVKTFAEERFEELLPQIAATLLLPGAAGELAAARRSLPSALAELARFLQAEKLTVVGVEARIEEKDTLAPGVGVAGWIDLHAATEAGRPVVIDLKWYFTDSYMRRELENGTALQLGVYARHVPDGRAGVDKADVAAGYFMLRQKRFLTTAPLGGGAATLVDGPTPQETWEKVLVSFGAAMQDIRSGDIRAAIEHDGVKPADFSDPYLLTPPRCGRCDYYGICGAHE
ncbi:PD-(D/E)XK nuclease family protein [Methylocystis sp. JAN1]|uniref:PD-(D/E)XK nuclease family protein n=1 Tax=Methylocystis sp. JAN1 TaxID=3397211 RepID=UPI003FA1AFF0